MKYINTFYLSHSISINNYNHHIIFNNYASLGGFSSVSGLLFLMPPTFERTLSYVAVEGGRLGVFFDFVPIVVYPAGGLVFFERFPDELENKSLEKDDGSW